MRTVRQIPRANALGIWLPVSHAPSCIVTTNPSRTGLNPLTQLFVQLQIKENIKALRHWPLWGEFTSDWWIGLIHSDDNICFHPSVFFFVFFFSKVPSAIWPSSLWSKGCQGYGRLPGFHWGCQGPSFLGHHTTYSIYLQVLQQKVGLSKTYSMLACMACTISHWGQDKWTPFGRQHFQMHFLEWKCLNSDYNFTEVCSQWTI